MLERLAAHDPGAGHAPPFPSDKDAALVARAKLDRQAFAPLYRRYVDPIYRYCYRCLGSRAAAEDATSQVFLKALAALPGFGGGSFRAWLFAIAHNVVADAFRQPPGEPIEAAGDVPDGALTPEELLLAAEAQRSVRGILTRLPAEQRSVVELRLAGLSGAEIAQALGRSLGSVKMLQFRAVQRLRTMLSAEPFSEETHDDRAW